MFCYKIHQKENLIQTTEGPRPPPAKIPKLTCTQSPSQRVTLPPTTTRTVLPQTVIAPNNKIKLQSSSFGVQKVIILLMIPEIVRYTLESKVVPYLFTLTKKSAF